jgi:hypothetical protein
MQRAKAEIRVLTYVSCALDPIRHSIGDMPYSQNVL